MNYLLTLLTLSTVLGFAKSTPWPVDELKRRFEVRGEFFMVDPTGKIVLHKGGNWNIWKTRDNTGKIESQWSSRTNNFTIAYRHIWQVQDDGSVKVNIEQFENVVETKGDGDGPLFEKSVYKTERVLENLE